MVVEDAEVKEKVREIVEEEEERNYTQRMGRWQAELQNVKTFTERLHRNQLFPPIKNAQAILVASDAK